MHRQVIRINKNSIAAKAMKQKNRGHKEKGTETQKLENLNSLLLVHARSSRRVRV